MRFLLPLLLLSPFTASACTAFLLHEGGRTFVGNNEDSWCVDGRVRFVPGVAGRLGAVYFSSWRGHLRSGALLRAHPGRSCTMCVNTHPDRIIERINPYRWSMGAHCLPRGEECHCMEHGSACNGHPFPNKSVPLGSDHTGGILHGLSRPFVELAPLSGGLISGIFPRILTFVASCTHALRCLSHNMRQLNGTQQWVIRYEIV